ncbi:peptidase inhibitor I9 [Streptomyces sp. TLI_55]|uniref:S8 family serine peptidase n=1 Tax=Streptomyces sp. TLI_55 TaxID=1938861 RepID=UPI000BD3753C|nr:S8 family serine peptidase [Streptomyces sp. TLI_55]SNX88342.1 peptidase inhibitor I9 [Streptomyces sp. TLI_55]
MSAAVLAVSLTALCPASPARAAGEPPTPVPVTGDLKSGRYIVTLADEPVALYRGGVDGLAATAPAPGGKLDTSSAQAHGYRDYLQGRQNKAAAAVGAKIRRHYSVVTNGFTANLTAVQAARLSGQPGVLQVRPDAWNKTTDDARSTDLMGLSGPNGVWSALGGTAKSGKGVVVGVVDTGIWPESKSFAAPALGSTRPTAKDPYRPYRSGDTIRMKKADGGTFTGTCQTGEECTAAACNSKLISARYFSHAYLAAVPPEQRDDYISPRDREGHGTHTASTAAGDADVQVTVAGKGFGKISGVAPGAAVAVYKALWKDRGGADSDIVAAIDQAVADGVDVINYSARQIVETSLDSPIQQAFRAAAQAGVFVSASAGNNGPSPAWIDNTAPWITTVAASTMATPEATVRLGDGRTFVGASVTLDAELGPKPLVPSTDVRLASAAQSAAALCQEGTLDPDKTAGKVVVCDRGVNTRVSKSAEVARAGGVGMVLVNTSDQDTDGDIHVVPTVHLNTPAATTVRAYAATPGATVVLKPGGSTGTPYPQIAPFSSRGPSDENKGALIKPDLAAPGVAVLAAVAPPDNQGHDFDFMSGTSMAAPQVAGLAALYFGVHPKWSPMAVKSALMTTAVDTKLASGGTNTDVYAQGSGVVNPAAMLNPGLVYDSSNRDWLAYEEGLGIDTGTGVAPVAPSDLNYPSLSVDQLLGSRTLTRTLTAAEPGTYRASVKLPGFTTKVQPATLHFTRAGQSAKVSIKLTRPTAPSGVAVTGSLTWTGSGRVVVRSPIVVTPQGLLAPEQISGTGSSGSVSYSVTPGTEKLTLTAYGPVAGAPVSGELRQETGGYQEFAVTVPEGSKAGAFYATTKDPAARVYLWIAPMLPDGTAGPGGALSDPTHQARVAMADLKPGKYLATVITGWSPGSAFSSDIKFEFQANVVGTNTPSKGTFSVSPTRPVTKPGVPFDVTGTWSGVDTSGPATAYVEYPDGTGTLVHIDG